MACYAIHITREGCVGPQDREAKFHLSVLVSDYIREPFSHGGGRGVGQEIDVTWARLLDWYDDDGVLRSRDEAMAAFGDGEVRDAELRARDRFDPCSLTEMEMAA